MLLAATLALTSCVPMRWISADPQSLRLLDRTAINCLLLEESQLSASFLDAARKRNLLTLAVAHDSTQAVRLEQSPADGLVLEGDFPFSPAKPAVSLTSRRAIPFQSGLPVLGTTQGVWPGVEVEHGGLTGARSAPTGSAWIHTNTGFLRFARANSPALFWMANRPPPDSTFPVARYAAAIADSAAAGARWVLALDDSFAKALLNGQPEALKGWSQLMALVRFYEAHSEWRSWRPQSELVLVQDTASGGLITGNLLDMLAVMNTPVRPIPSRELTAATLQGAKVTVTINPQAYSEEQKALMARFSKNGGRIVSGPANWKMPDPPPPRITFDKQNYKDLEAIWPELHMAIQRKNFGARMFNVSGTLTYLQMPPNGRAAVLHLVNYTGYAVESITAFVQGKWAKATLLTPQDAPKNLATYDAPEGTAVEIETLQTAAAVFLEN